MVQRVSIRTVPQTCPRCGKQNFIRLVPMPPDVEPIPRFRPITQVLEIGGRVVLGLVCGKCGELLAEGQRPLALKAEFPHNSQCPGKPALLDLTAETEIKRQHLNDRRLDQAHITFIIGCVQCDQFLDLKTTVGLYRSQYDIFYPGKAKENGG